MAGIPASVLRDLGQDVTIEPYGGVAVSGADDFGAAVTVRAIVEESDGTDRTQTPTDDVKVMAVLRCALDTDCPAGSRVTLTSGKAGIATNVKRWDGGRSPAPSHLEIAISANVAP